ncbi:DUF4259 domain-containing protein [Kitasatospora sp. NPDC028055]|uniref:DUF4259 domain-containing protein n=1 Tax=Kitasatospora sp. NPDC028055 TaxID=3155653 RepID=UPI0033E03FB7
MGSWDTGPFHNDAAVGTAERFDSLSDSELPPWLHRLFDVAVAMPEGPLDPDMAQEVVAAAAVIASQCPGGDDVNLNSGPREPVPPLPTDLRPKASAALDRVLAHADAEVNRWYVRERGEQWLANVQRISAILADPASDPEPAVPGPQLRVFAGQQLLRDRFGVEDALDLPARHPKGSPAHALADLLERQSYEVDTLDRELRATASRAGETLAQVAEGKHGAVQTNGVLRFTGVELETLGARFAQASRDLQGLANGYQHAVNAGTDQAVAPRSAAARTQTTPRTVEAGLSPAAAAPPTPPTLRTAREDSSASTPATHQMSVARALDALAPHGTVRVLMAVRLSEPSAEGLKALRITAADPLVGLHPADVAEHHRAMERQGLLRTTSAGLETTTAARELWPVFLAAAGWTAKHRNFWVCEEPIECAVEEALRIGAQPLTAPVLDRLRAGPATEDDLAGPMTAAARAQLPDQLTALARQDLLQRRPDGALQATAAGIQLAEVHDALADWYAQHLAPAAHADHPHPNRRTSALAGSVRSTGEEPPARPPTAGPAPGAPSHRR